MTKQGGTDQSRSTEIKSVCENPAVGEGLELMAVTGRARGTSCHLIADFMAESCHVVAHADDLGVRFTSNTDGKLDDHGWVPWDVLESLLTLKQTAQALTPSD